MRAALAEAEAMGGALGTMALGCTAAAGAVGVLVSSTDGVGVAGVGSCERDAAHTTPPRASSPSAATPAVR